MRTIGLVLIFAAVGLAACERPEGPDVADTCLTAQEAEARIEACTRAAQDETRAPEQRSIAFSTRGGAYEEAGDVTAALRDFGAALELDEDNPQAVLGRARILLASGQLDAAEPLARQAAERQNAAEGHDMLGRIALLRSDYAGAIPHFDAALERNDRMAVALAGRARAKQRLNDLEGARADYNAAVRANGNLAEARAGRCWLDLMAETDLDRARNDAEAAVAADPAHVDGQLCRGVLQLRDGEWAGARASFDAALAVEPGNPTALFGRGVARRRSGDNDGREDMNLARDFDSHIGATFDDLGVETY